MGRRPQRVPRVAPTIYRFGDCRIDLSGRELRRGGELVVLSPRVFDCLALLIAHADRAVGRDELVAHVWGKTEVTDTLLGQTILKARRAVGDSATEQKSIRTIPRFGYAWVAPLAHDEGEGEGHASRPAESASSAGTVALRERRSMARRGIALGALLVVIAAAGAWLAWRGVDEEPVAPVAADSAAVLPIVVTAPAEWSWVRLGLMDAIAARLQQGGQRVVPGDNVVAIARSVSSGATGDTVREATGARYTVSGTAALNPDGWTLRLELRDGSTLLAAETHDAEILLAGRQGADRLLQLLGRNPPPASDEPWPELRLLQRAESALLTNDLEGARRLLQSAPPSLRDSPELRLQLAQLDFRAGDFEAANRRLQALLAQSPVEADPLMRAKVLNGIGHVAMRLGRVEAAAEAYAAAATLLEDQAEPRELGHAWMGRGIAAQSQGRYDDASTDFARAHVAFELAGDGLALARVEANEGLMDGARDRHAAAAVTLERAARRFEQFGALNELAMTSSALVGVHLALLDPPSALAASERAWAMRERLEDAGIRHALSINRALALDANGRVGEASALLEAVAREADPVAQKSVRAVARSELARIQLDAGRAERATPLALMAVADLGPGADIRDRLTAWLVAIRALRATGDVGAAAERTAQLVDWSAAQREPVAGIHARLASAEQRVSEQHEDDAEREYRAALEQATRAGVPADIAVVASSYGRHLLALGDMKEASAVVGQVARWANQDYGCALLQLRLHAALGERQAWARALANARRLAGDRTVPPDLGVPPGERGGRRAAP
jgi:DNA-binding winged helix-turn-helix (wHTH) protein/tetratricopeptide (TPR) repeat protein